MKTQQTRPLAFKLILIGLYSLAFAAFFYFLIDGWHFYTLPQNLRLRAPEYSNLKPGGFRSHGLGIIGSLMMLLMLTYSARKRWTFMRDWGALPRWLDIHIFFGISGPLFVILHSTFKVSGLVAVSFWSMIAVALSGVIGRYLYVQIPRNVQGVELSLDQTQKLVNQQRTALKLEYGFEEQEMDELKNLIGGHIKGRSFLAIFTAFILFDLKFLFRKQVIQHRIKNKFQLPAKEIHRLMSLFIKEVKLEHRIQFWNQIHRVFHYWHVIHKPFAIIMYLIMFIHAGIAVWLGYTWF